MYISNNQIIKIIMKKEFKKTLECEFYNYTLDRFIRRKAKFLDKLNKTKINDFKKGKT